MRLSTFALLVASFFIFAPRVADAAFCFSQMEAGLPCPPSGQIGLLPHPWDPVVYVNEPVVFSISLRVTPPATSAYTPIEFSYDAPFVETGIYGSGLQYYLHGYFPDPGTAPMVGWFYDNLGNYGGIGGFGQGECCGAYNVTVLAVADTPEPSTWAMLLIGFAAIGCAGYRRSKSQHVAPDSANMVL
jgi:hypothetical protein